MQGADAICRTRKLVRVSERLLGSISSAVLRDRVEHVPIQGEVLSDDRSGRTRRRQLLYKITWLDMVLRGSAEDHSACEGAPDLWEIGLT